MGRMALRGWPDGLYPSVTCATAAESDIYECLFVYVLYILSFVLVNAPQKQLFWLKLE